MYTNCVPSFRDHEIVCQCVNATTWQPKFEAHGFIKYLYNPGSPRIKQIRSLAIFQFFSLAKNLAEFYMWVFPKIMVPQNGWFIMEIPIKMDVLGGKPHYFRKHPYITPWCFFRPWAPQVVSDIPPCFGRPCQSPSVGCFALRHSLEFLVLGWMGDEFYLEYL